MKIYKLDIDTSKPIRKVVQMQQNATGVLSVNVTKNGNYIRNLSCQMFDGDTEIPASDNGFKLAIGDTPKHYMVKATATPVECSAQTYVGGNGGRKTFFCEKIQLSAGTYNQDEFQNIVDVVGNKSGFQTNLYPTAQSLSAINFSFIVLTPKNPSQQLWFRNADNTEWMNPDEPIVATADAIIGVNQTAYRNAQLSTFVYPAIGYYVDYQADTIIKSSTNANAYSEEEILPAEADFARLSTDSFTLSGVTYVPTTLSVDGVAYTVLAASVETPDPDPEPEPEPEETPEEPTDGE